METLLQVLSAEECSRIHEETLKILQGTGVRVDTKQGRDFLGAAGANVDENTHIIRFPPALVEKCLAVAPKEFSLGSRRSGKLLTMNQGECSVIMDGGAIHTYDAEAGVRRPSTREDWFLATRLGDCLDVVDVYWSVIEAAGGIPRARW